MKGRRALPSAEALTGQKPRQRLTLTAIIKLLRNRKHLTQRPTYPIQQEGEIGVPCVAASCACLGAGKGQAERQSEKMLSSFVVRFFRLPPLPDTAAALRRPATLAPLHSAGAAPASVCGSKASRFRGSLLARGFLVAPRTPKRFSFLATF